MLIKRDTTSVRLRYAKIAWKNAKISVHTVLNILKKIDKKNKLFLVKEKDVNSVARSMKIYRNLL